MWNKVLSAARAPSHMGMQRRLRQIIFVALALAADFRRAGAGAQPCGSVALGDSLTAGYGLARRRRLSGGSAESPARKGL